MDELRSNTIKLGRRKSPGLEGVTIEFYSVCWEFVAEDLLKAAYKGLGVGSFHIKMINEDIVLVPKTGHKRLLKNKRPLTLLNAMYKIITKALQLRLTPILQKIIAWNQSTFLAGRSIHATVLTCNEVLS